MSTTQFETDVIKYKVICNRQWERKEWMSVINCPLKYMKNAFSILILVGGGWMFSYILP